MISAIEVERFLINHDLTRELVEDIVDLVNKECNLGYYNGYNDGYEQGRSDGFDLGYEEGFVTSYDGNN